MNRKTTSNNLRAEGSESLGSAFGIRSQIRNLHKGLSLTSEVRAQEAAALRNNRLSNVFTVAVLLC